MADENTTPPTPETLPTPPATPPAAPARTFTQEDVDRMITARLEREKAARDKETAKAQEDAEAKRLEEQKEFAKLAAKHEGRVRELEPELESTKAERDALREYVTSEIEERTKGWPDSLKALIPAEGTATARLAAFNAAKAAYEELKGERREARANNPGNSPRQPRPAGNDQDPTAAVVQAKRASGRYSL